jgi:ribonuclease HI
MKTNNQAEFNALLYLLVDAYCNGITRIHIYGDSKLAVNSANKLNKIANQNIVSYA